MRPRKSRQSGDGAPVAPGAAPAAPRFRPIQRQAAADQVVSTIIDMLLSGQLRAGESLPPERELAVQLGVGRPAVREALRALKALDIVHIKHGDATRIATLEPEGLADSLSVFLAVGTLTLDHVFDARLVLETGIAEAAARHIDAASIDALEACLAEEAEFVDDPVRFQQTDIRLHLLIAQATGNPVLVSLLRSISKLGEATRRRTGAVAAVRRQALADHQAILAALQAHDSGRAREAMRAHLENVRRLFATAQGG